MIRMEIALFLVMGMVAFIYFSSEKKITKLHRTFSVLLVTVLVYLAFDRITVYTVNHLDTVPSLLNNLAHRVFMGSMALVIFLFYRYIAILVEEETGKPRKMDKAAWVILVLSELGNGFCPFIIRRQNGATIQTAFIHMSVMRVWDSICSFAPGCYLETGKRSMRKRNLQSVQP